MKKAFLYIFVLGIVSVFSSTLFAGISNEQQIKLWADLVEVKANPALSKLGRWNVIEGMTLIKKVDDVSLKAAALAAIIDYYNGKGNDEIWFGAIDTKKQFPKIMAIMEEADWKTEKNMLKFLTQINELHDERFPKMKASAKSTERLTSGMDMSSMLEKKYLQKNGNDIALATRAFAANRGMEVEVTVRNDMRFDELADLIDKQNPVILQPAATDHFLICVGYIRQGTEEYLITADPDKIMFEEYSHAAEIKGAGKYKQFVENMERKEGLARRDMKIRITNGLQPGVEITDWKSGKYTALVIRNFDVTEASYEKYLKFIKASPEILIWPSFGEKEFKKQASEWIPLGISVIDAEKIMKTKEFNCERYTHKAANNYKAYEELSCQRYGPDLIAARQRWNVYLTIKDEKIVEVGAMSGGY